MRKYYYRLFFWKKDLIILYLLIFRIANLYLPFLKIYINYSSTKNRYKVDIKKIKKLFGIKKYNNKNNSNLLIFIFLAKNNIIIRNYIYDSNIDEIKFDINIKPALDFLIRDSNFIIIIDIKSFI